VERWLVGILGREGRRVAGWWGGFAGLVAVLADVLGAAEAKGGDGAGAWAGGRGPRRGRLLCGVCKMGGMDLGLGVGETGGYSIC